MDRQSHAHGDVSHRIAGLQFRKSLTPLAVVAAVVLASLPGAAAQGPRSSDQRANAPTVTSRSGEPADLALSDGWVSGRYRLTPSDVVELSFPYVPEFNQTLTVQPDGYITLRAVGDLRVQGRTLPELEVMLREAYEPILREPVMTIVLKDFEKPYFIASGEVKTPGKFELRGATTVTQALAVAGGFTVRAKHSQVVLFRRYSNELVEVKQIDVKQMLAARDLSEDYLLRPGDTLFVPKSVLSRLAPLLPIAGLAVYLNPLTR